MRKYPVGSQSYHGHGCSLWKRTKSRKRVGVGQQQPLRNPSFMICCCTTGPDIPRASKLAGLLTSAISSHKAEKMTPSFRSVDGKSVIQRSLHFARPSARHLRHRPMYSICFASFCFALLCPRVPVQSKPNQANQPNNRMCWLGFVRWGNEDFRPPGWALRRAPLPLGCSEPPWEYQRARRARMGGGLWTTHQPHHHHHHHHHIKDLEAPTKAQICRDNCQLIVYALQSKY